MSFKFPGGQWVDSFVSLNYFKAAGATQYDMTIISSTRQVNSMAPGGFDYSLKLVNFKLISTINIWNIFCKTAIRWMPQYLTDH